MANNPFKRSEGPSASTLNVEADKPASPPPSRKGKEKATGDAPASLLHRLAGPSTGKAGLGFRDPAEVERIIYENSKNSKFFLAEQEKDRKLTLDIERLLAGLEEKTRACGGDVGALEAEADRICESLDRTRVLDRSIVCVDADAFYASVEERDNPDLRDKPFAVGGGVLTTANYVARRWGCRSAMPGFIAKKLCPTLTFVKPDFVKYSAASDEIFKVLRAYDPNLSGASLDEAYLDLTDYCCEHHLSVSEAVQRLRDDVRATTRLTVSAGAGPNAMIAKIAADMRKPDGQCIVEPTREAAMAFMAPLKVRKVPGVGRVTERILESLAIRTVGDIFARRGQLVLLRGQVGLEGLLSSYLALGSTVIQPGTRAERKSMGCESTFDVLWKPDDLRRKISDIAEELSRDLERSHFSGRTLTLKFKLDTFQVYTRATTLGSGMYLSNAEDLFKHGWALLNHEIEARKAESERERDGRRNASSPHLRLRLLGLKMTNLRDELAATTSNPLQQWTSVVGAAEGQAQATASDKADVDGRRFVSCPSCGARVSASLQSFNAHLDQCLAGGAAVEVPGPAAISSAPKESGPKRPRPAEMAAPSKRQRDIADWLAGKPLAKGGL